MKSYDEHLKTLLNKAPSYACHRSSALFPIFSDANISMRILFLNYWKVKRNIEHVLCRLFVRSIKGETLVKKCFYVDKLKAYNIELSSLVSRRVPFGGSLEIEFTSPSNLVFPFPAVTVHYQGRHFSTFVHSAERTYNDAEDQKINARPFSVESGFNIYADEKYYPFITFVNGKTPLQTQKILIAAYNSNQKVIGTQIKFSSKRYETTYIHLNQWKELKNHLQNQAGCLKVKLNSKGVFPRLIVGNRSKEGDAISVTHSYYDLVAQNKPSDFWKAPNETWQAAALMLPVLSPQSFQTSVYFYPIYSPLAFAIDLEIYTLHGKKVKQISNFLISPKVAHFQKKDLTALVPLKYTSKSCLFKLIARPLKGDLIPARIKVGFDVGFKRQGLPCNICTNFYPANPSLDQKPRTFRWTPLMAKSFGGEIWCINDAPKTSYQKKANVLLTLYRPQDEKKLEINFSLSPYSAYTVSHTQEISEFLEGKTGWCTFDSDNPFITTYTFSLHSSRQVVGGDHGF